MTELLDGGADINEVAVMTPLQMAALNGQLGSVEVLIERGADLNATTSIIGAALHAAAQRGHADIVAALVN